MAPRLIRWTWMTLAAVAGAMVVALPPGPSVLGVIFGYGTRTSPPLSPLDAALQETGDALRLARADLDRMQWAEGVERSAAEQRSPLGLSLDLQPAPGAGARRLMAVVRPDLRLTAAAESVWRAIPHRAGAPRTVLLFDPLDEWSYGAPASSDNSRCYAVIAPRRGPLQVAIRNSAGSCALVTEFGVPGRAIRVWLDSMPGIPIQVVRRLPAESETFTATPLRGYFGEYRQYRHYPFTSSYAQQACAGGRLDQCAFGLGFGSRVPNRADMGWWWLSQWRPVGIRASIFGDLIADMGPQDFGELWRSDAPVAESYVRLTGRPFEEWAVRYTRALIGQRIPDNRLSWTGWLGWLVWMGLLGVWMAVRLREGSAA